MLTDGRNVETKIESKRVLKSCTNKFATFGIQEMANICKQVDELYYDTNVRRQ